MLLPGQRVKVLVAFFSLQRNFKLKTYQNKPKNSQHLCFIHQMEIVWEINAYNIAFPQKGKADLNSCSCFSSNILLD